MDLRITRATLQEPLKLETLFSVSSTSRSLGLLGLFDHLSGVTVAHYESDWPDFIDLTKLVDEIKASLTTAQESPLSLVIKRTALIHELRHYHDCFLTPVGVQLLEAFGFAYGLIGSIAREVIKMRVEQGERVVFPLLRLLKEDRIHHSIHSAFADSHRILFTLALNIGATPLTIVEGHDFESDFYILTVFDEYGSSYDVPCANVNILVNEQRHHALWPLGLCLVSECLATIEQVAFVNDIDHTIGVSYFNSFREGLTPYLPLHTTFTRILRSRGIDVQNSPAYEKVLYESLWRSLFAPGGTIMPHANGVRPAPGFIGRELIRQLRENVDASDGCLRWTPPDLDRSLHIKQSAFVNAGLPDVFLSYVRHEYLNKALSDDGGAIRYATREWYLARLGALPNAPMVLTSEGQSSVNDPRFFELWQNWMFFRDLAHRSLFADIFVCPVRHPQTSGFYRPYELFPSGDTCRKGLEECRCGFWKAGSEYEGPACFWTRHLSQMLYLPNPGPENTS